MKLNEGEYSFENIKDVINSIPNNFNILEEVVDIEVQKEFFETTTNFMIDENADVSVLVDILNNEKTSLEERKSILKNLASIDSIDAFRAIEKYNQSPLPELKEWTILSLQQSRMIIQSSLLDEQQVFISTGLGGKKDKLRYFLIFPYHHPIESLHEYQISALKNELEFNISKNDGTIEQLEFNNKYAAALILLPLKAPIPEIIKDIIEECNQFGYYLSSDALITNMRKFNNEEIIQIIESNEFPEE